jgi:L,D-peptidoglycan transpeptidase YkuD (ErfK/YbiS/YcfS/YnhG family)
MWIRLAGASGLARMWGPTDGCIALMNEDVQVVYESVRVGTPVIISP